MLGALLGEAIQLRFGDQASFAECVGVSQASVSRWVRGHSAPEFGRWLQLEEALGLESGAIGAAVTAEAPADEVVDSMRVQVAELTGLVESLIERVRVLEGRGG